MRDEIPNQISSYAISLTARGQPETKCTWLYFSHTRLPINKPVEQPMHRPISPCCAAAKMARPNGSLRPDYPEPSCINIASCC